LAEPQVVPSAHESANVGYGAAKSAGRLAGAEHAQENIFYRSRTKAQEIEIVAKRQ
jgi:hypothetical protein